MTHALVLGGGGPVGIGWEAGLLVGLADNGVDVKKADAVVGTSAGSVVGFTVASGGDLTAAPMSFVAGVNQSMSASPPSAALDAQQQLDQFVAALGEAAMNPEMADRILTEMGRKALAAKTISEAQWLEMFSTFAAAEWPAGFSCTALSTIDGSFRVWNKTAGVDPQLAIASSCAVPGVFPPVTIGDARWMDGGGRDILNADVAAGHAVVLAVSCVLLEMPPEFSTPAFDALLAVAGAQLDSLRAGGARVETIVPGQEMLEVSGAGTNLLDFTRAGDAYEAGLRQGKVEAARLTGFWE
jgi:NTE family protein